MKFVSFSNNQSKERLGFIYDSRIADAAANGNNVGLTLPSTSKEFLQDYDRNLNLVRKIEKAIRAGKTQIIFDFDSVNLLAPVPYPPSCRDAYAFRQHVETARRNRGASMIPEFDEFPVFYFSNHHSITGPGAIIVEKDHLQNLDFELECAIVIGRQGRNIEAAEADAYIAGYTIMNDFSARVLQMEEMKLSLGPAKGKDFATAIGPGLVTPDELEAFRIATDAGNKYDLSMKAYHNGKCISSGNLKDMQWTFAEIIERCSYGVDLYPGDIIGSGTVGTGCFLELNGTGAREANDSGKKFEPVWLKDEDTIELEVAGLGKLTNTIRLSDNDVSILEKKKNKS